MRSLLLLLMYVFLLAVLCLSQRCTCGFTLQMVNRCRRTPSMEPGWTCPYGDRRSWCECAVEVTVWPSGPRTSLLAAICAHARLDLQTSGPRNREPGQGLRHAAGDLVGIAFAARIQRPHHLLRGCQRAGSGRRGRGLRNLRRRDIDHRCRRRHRAMVETGRGLHCTEGTLASFRRGSLFFHHGCGSRSARPPH